jgi:hypothetical protein
MIKLTQVVYPNTEPGPVDVPLWLDPSHIVAVMPYQHPDSKTWRSTIHTVRDAQTYDVRETPEQVVALIEAATK